MGGGVVSDLIAELRARSLHADAALAAKVVERWTERDDDGLTRAAAWASLLVDGHMMRVTQAQRGTWTGTRWKDCPNSEPSDCSYEWEEMCLSIEVLLNALAEKDAEIELLNGKEEAAVEMIVDLRTMSLRLCRALAKHPQNDELVKQCLALLDRHGILGDGLALKGRTS